MTNIFALLAVILLCGCMSSRTQESGTSTTSAERQADGCGGFSDEVDRDNCYLNLASSLANSTFCHKIGNAVLRGTCIGKADLEASARQSTTTSTSSTETSTSTTSSSTTTSSTVATTTSAPTTTLETTTVEAVSTTSSTIPSADDGKISTGTCTSTNPGIEYFVKGVVTDKNGRVSTDYCIISEKYPGRDGVRKYYCNANGFAALIDYQCPTQCMDGACLKSRIAGSD
ncbi:MAG: hypothetical protein V1875_01530 [Candidatus Altiarchaeota archaeon]